MNEIEITRFHSGLRGYTKADASNVLADADTGFAAISQHISVLIEQLRSGRGKPRGLSFAAYRGSRCVNKDTNIKSVHALALDYRAAKVGEVAEAAAALGYAHILFDTEDRASTVNAITLVIPFAAPLSAAQYARVASCIATELGVYGLLEGALAATHIINIHATSLTASVPGELFDAESYIKRTAREFQGRDARKFEGPEPVARQAARVQIERPVFTTHDGLFQWSEADANVIPIGSHRLTDEAIPDLTAYGELIED